MKLLLWMAVVLAVVSSPLVHAKKRTPSTFLTNKLAGITIGAEPPGRANWPEVRVNTYLGESVHQQAPQLLYRDDEKHTVITEYMKSRNGYVTAVMIYFSFESQAICERELASTFESFAKANKKPTHYGDGRQVVWPVGEHHRLVWLNRCDRELSGFEVVLR